jgi:hypothetical protein
MAEVDVNEQLRRDRVRTAKEADDALQKPDEELLKEIFFCADDHLGHNPSTRISHTLAYFSSLLINLSRKAEESTNKMEKYTKQLLYLTWVIAFLTVVLLILGVLEFMK